MLLTAWLACSTPEPPAPEPASEPAPTATPQPHRPHGGVDQKQQHPPLPKDLSIWSWDAGGFVNDIHWYGEHSWDGVRMRVAGHLAVAGRDRARLAAEQGDLEGCADRYDELVQLLGEIPESRDAWSRDIHSNLVEAAQRDASLCRALARGVPVPESDGLAGLRARALNGETGLDDELAVFETPRTDLGLEDFENFDDRHQLRVRLFDAYLDSVDPLGFSEPWGYWTADQIALQARAIRETQGRAREATLRARELQPATTFTAEGLGWLPTGDSLIDVGAQPGPKAIGTLTVLGLDDPEHRAWLEAVATELNATTSGDLPAALEPHIARLDATGYGSRFYNIKQLRNEAVRQLASRGDHDIALQVLDDNWPLHNQDWACPNREGILLGLKGRLEARAGLASADDTLVASIEAGKAFLADVNRAERGEDVGVKPPPMGPPPG